MTLLPGEEQLVTSNNEKIVLTTQRIVMRDIERSYMHSVEIFLEDISSIEIKYTSNIKLLQFGVLGVLGVTSFYFNIASAIGPGIILLASLILIGWWWFSRQHIVSISSKGGGALNFQIDSIPLEKIEAFIDKVQQAKAARIKQLYRP